MLQRWPIYVSLSSYGIHFNSVCAFPKACKRLGAQEIKNPVKRQRHFLEYPNIGQNMAVEAITAVLCIFLHTNLN